MFFVDGGAVMGVVGRFITSGWAGGCCTTIEDSCRFLTSVVFTSIGFGSSIRDFTSSFFSKDNLMCFIASTGGRGGDFSFGSINRDG
jgi:hypothetical protein